MSSSTNTNKVITGVPPRFSSLISQAPDSVRNWFLFPYHTLASPIIVGGCGRSGTNLMRAILDSHPQICCGPETNLFSPDVPPLPLTQPFMINDDIPRRLSWLYDLSEYSVEKLWRNCCCLAEFIECFFYLNCNKHRKTIWAEKTPGNIQNLDWIFYYWPRARVIHMIRDGRDVACSLRFHPKLALIDGTIQRTNRINKIDDCLKRWIRNVRAGRVWQGKPNYYEIRYEEIVTEPQKTLAALFEWLQIDWDPSVLNFHEVSRDLEKDPNAEGFQRPLYTSSISRWTRELSYEELLTARKLAGDLLAELGYASAHWSQDV